MQLSLFTGGGARDGNVINGPEENKNATTSTNSRLEEKPMS